MRVLVIYGSRLGATRGIAECITSRLRQDRLDVTVQPASEAVAFIDADAFVIGSGVYSGHWVTEAADYVRQNRAVLVHRPVWLFSSGPLGTEALDAKGRDQKVAAVPKEVPELLGAVGARDHRVFFGAYEKDRKLIGLAERFVSVMPAAREALPEGDFRDWPEIEAWAAGIARDLSSVPPL